MDLNRFTTRAQESVAAAQRLAADSGHAEIETLHLLHALVAQQQGVVPEIIAKIGGRPQAVLYVDMFICIYIYTYRDIDIFIYQCIH